MVQIDLVDFGRDGFGCWACGMDGFGCWEHGEERKTLWQAVAKWEKKQIERKREKE